LVLGAEEEISKGIGVYLEKKEGFVVEGEGTEEEEEKQ